MSGGNWNYLSQVLEDQGDALEATKQMYYLLAALEHELDWGISGDTCYACAQLRMAPALEAFFTSGAKDATAAVAIARDQQQHMCERCTERAAERKRQDAERLRRALEDR